MNSRETNKTKKQGPIEFDVHFRIGRHGRQKLEIRQASCNPSVQQKVIPRISRLMALAIKMNGMLESGIVENYAELALLGHVSRARLTQIMNLLNLAPDIQEKILFLEGDNEGHETVTERRVRNLMKENEWKTQRQLWRQTVGDAH